MNCSRLWPDRKKSKGKGYGVPGLLSLFRALLEFCSVFNLLFCSESRASLDGMRKGRGWGWLRKGSESVPCFLAQRKLKGRRGVGEFFFTFLPYSWAGPLSQTHMGQEKELNPWVDFLMVLMASGIARGRVCTTTATMESRKMASILQIVGWQKKAGLVYCELLWHPCYDQLTPVKTRHPLTSITWPYRGLRFRTHRGHVLF